LWVIRNGKQIFWLKKKKKMSTTGSNRPGARPNVRPLETENSSIHREPVGRNFPKISRPPQPTNLGRLLENDGHKERKMAELHEPHKWKTNENGRSAPIGLKRCLRSTPFKSIFWSSQRFLPQYFFFF
jgi:hypothetical protein